MQHGVEQKTTSPEKIISNTEVAREVFFLVDQIIRREAKDESGNSWKTFYKTEGFFNWLTDKVLQDLRKRGVDLEERNSLASRTASLIVKYLENYLVTGIKAEKREDDLKGLLALPDYSDQILIVGLNKKVEASPEEPILVGTTYEQPPRPSLPEIPSERKTLVQAMPNTPEGFRSTAEIKRVYWGDQSLEFNWKVAQDRENIPVIKKRKTRNEIPQETGVIHDPMWFMKPIGRTIGKFFTVVFYPFRNRQFFRAFLASLVLLSNPVKLDYMQEEPVSKIEIETLLGGSLFNFQENFYMTVKNLVTGTKRFVIPPSEVVIKEIVSERSVSAEDVATLKKKANRLIDTLGKLAVDVDNPTEDHRKIAKEFHSAFEELAVIYRDFNDLLQKPKKKKELKLAFEKAEFILLYMENSVKVLQKSFDLSEK